MLTQKLLPLLRQSRGRILHIGTNIAFNAQVGTSTYGITKMAFYRLYQQLKVDLEGTGMLAAFIIQLFSNVDNYVTCKGYYTI